MRIAAGLRPDPLGELERSPRPPSPNSGGGCLLLRGKEGKEMGKGKEGLGRGKRGREGEGTEKRGRADPHPGLGKCKGGNPSGHA